MEHSFFWNSNSFPASSKDEAFIRVMDTCRGMLSVVNHGDRLSIYSNQPHKLNNNVLYEGYTFGNFVNDISDNEDLELALREIDDKSPVLEKLSDEEFEEITEHSYYFQDESYECSNEVIALAWFYDAVLLSIPTSERWKQDSIKFCRYADGASNQDTYYLRNISCIEHGRKLKNFYRDLSFSLDALSEKCHFSDKFSTWFKELTIDNKNRVYSKLLLAIQKNFEGGEPLFKSIHDDQSLREIRLRAYPGGAIRILFKRIAEDNWAILVGFIKKKDNEGYFEAIEMAHSILREIE